MSAGHGHDHDHGEEGEEATEKAKSSDWERRQMSTTRSPPEMDAGNGVGGAEAKDFFFFFFCRFAF